MALIQRTVNKVIHYRRGDTLVGIDICVCDLCNINFEQRIVDTINRRNGKIANGRDICKPCTIIENKKSIAAIGTKALKSRSKEDIIADAKRGGIASSKSTKPNTSKFSTERWNNKTPEEQYAQVKRASDGLLEKLKDPIFAAQHFAKVLAQKQLGYMSKAHKDLHELIKDLGFKSHVQIGRMQVDECNEDLKIVIEYNGDMWHCNPKTWKAEDYNSAIRMTAGEKWQKDIARHSMLRKMGYKTITIWESSWCRDATRYIDRIKDTCNEIGEQKRNSEGNLLRFISEEES